MRPTYAALARQFALLLFTACGSDPVATQPLVASDGSVPSDASSAEADAADAPEDAGGAAPPDAQASGLPAECRAPQATPFDPTLLPVCPSCAGGARCVPRVLLGARSPAVLEQLAACDAQSVCVPDPILTSLGFYNPQRCESLNAAEGRCLSECLPAVASQRDILPQAGCDAHERCVPCFHPLDGKPTGACAMPCDPGPSDPTPRLFPSCCGDAGACLPMSLIPEDQRALLGRDSCEAEDSLCTPHLLRDSEMRPASCNSVAGAEGRCLPTCLPTVAARAANLPQDSCADGEVCTPCVDPFTGADTGACRLHGDAPAREPRVFAQCCGGVGACVPAELVPASDAQRLSRAECGDAASLCVPRAFLDEAHVPASCRSLADAEGRCLPACLLGSYGEVPLPQGSCADGELCAPCYNPVDGSETGACALRGDRPREPAVRLDTSCCGTSGRCIPEALAGASGSALPADRCESELGQGWVCAPKSVVEDPSRRQNPFASCKMNFGLFKAGRGKCVPQCMIDAKGWVKRLMQRSSCASGELCVLCSLGDVPGC